MESRDYNRLIRKARQALGHSIAPYSRFRVGAALLTGSGTIFTGCNLESSSYSLTICAERTALFKALSEGHRRFRAIAIVSNVRDLIPPCGACRQVLMEHAKTIDVVMSDSRGKTVVMKISSLLPVPFTKRFFRRPESA